jgi:hypothetical protein
LFWNWVIWCLLVCFLFDCFIRMIQIAEFGLLGFFRLFFYLTSFLIL